MKLPPGKALERIKSNNAELIVTSMLKKYVKSVDMSLFELTLPNILKYEKNKNFRMIYGWLRFIYCRRHVSRLFNEYYAEHIIIQRLRETGLLSDNKAKHNDIQDFVGIKLSKRIKNKLINRK